jgi:hypothetical protein
MKILIISIISWSLYFFLNDFERLNITIFQLKESNSIYGFGYYILFNILKWMLFVFGIGSLIMFLNIILNKNSN